MKRLIQVLFTAALPVLLWLPAHAQSDYPNKPIRVIVSFAPAGPVDVIARMLAQKMSEKLGQSVVVENRPGAGGNIAAKFVAGVPVDGYIVLATSSALAVNQTFYKDPGYDAPKDFTPIALAATSPNIIVAHPSIASNTLREFIRDYKGKPVAYASAGVGSTPHLTADNLLRVQSGLDAVHVPFQGGGPAVTAVLGGQPPLGSISLPPTLPHIKAGKLKALAVTSLKRIDALPNVPTAIEAGFPDFEDSTWVAFLGPANLPQAIAMRLNAAINEALRDPGIRERLGAAGFEGTPGTPADFGAYLQKEIAKWSKIIKDTGATVQ